MSATWWCKQLLNQTWWFWSNLDPEIVIIWIEIMFLVQNIVICFLCYCHCYKNRAYKNIQETACECPFFFFFFTFLDLFCYSVKIYLSKVLFILNFPYTGPPVLHHTVIFLHAGRVFRWISEAELLPFHKKEGKIQKGRREDKDPINSCWVNRQTGTAEQESPLKRRHIFFWWQLIILFKI